MMLDDIGVATDFCVEFVCLGRRPLPERIARTPLSGHNAADLFQTCSKEGHC
jgi:hypothetical protein